MAASLANLLLGFPSASGGSAHLGCLNMPLIILSQKLRLPARRSQPKRLEIRASGDTLGTYFRVTTFEEPHGGSVGCVIDGCPHGLTLSEADIQVDRDRRLDQSRITTSRKETHPCKITSGIAEGLTTGAPIKIEVPSTYQITHDGGSAGETIGKVVAGSVAKKVLNLYYGIEIFAYVSQVHNVVLPEGLVDHDTLTIDLVDSNIVRCPNLEYAEKMIVTIDSLRVRGKSTGGVVTCIVRNVPLGLGPRGFHKLEAELCKAFMSLPAAKGFELGQFMICNEHDNEFDVDNSGRMRTETNLSWGIQGGVSNGEIIEMRIAFKSAATISRRQNPLSRDKQEMELVARGLHDLCVAPQACVMVQAMAELVLVDRLMAQHMLD